MLQVCSPYGWQDLSKDKLLFIREKLGNFESMTWKEILLDGKKSNHVVKIRRLHGDAQNRLAEIFVAIDFDDLVSLRLGAKERVWGLLEGPVLRVLWWDPEHQVCPSLLRDT
jgi:hypothetical protein